MWKRWVKKLAVFIIIYLFIGFSIQSSRQSVLTLQTVNAFKTNSIDQFSSANDTKYYAVISACSQYEDPKNNIPRFIPASDSKLKVLYDALLQTENWHEENIILLLNEKATRKSILDALETMSTIVGPNDIFLFTWNGHGTKAPVTDGADVVSICPYDTTICNGSFLNLITSDELGVYFSKIHAKGKCLVFECCFSGGLVDGGDSIKKIKEGLGDIRLFEIDFIRELMNPVTMDVSGNNTVVIMSTLPFTLGHATYITHSPLLYSIAKIVKNAHRYDKNNDGFVSAEEIFQRARPMMLLHSSFYWIFIWLSAYFFFKFDLYNLYFSIPRIHTLFQSYDKLVPFPALAATSILSVAYLNYQLFFKMLYGHYLLNWPNMKDDYWGDLPLVEL